VLIFDCNGVLVDSEAIVTTVVAQELTRAGFSVVPEVVARFFTGRRPLDMIADIEKATRRKLPPDFLSTLTAETMRRLHDDLQPTAHAAYALSWLRGRKCVASSAPLERIRMSLECTGLLRYFDPYLFSASEVANGKPAPDLFLHAADRMQIEPANCIVV
jgi:HAD superfamily hydrolase (TIGR01509 family)